VPTPRLSRSPEEVAYLEEASKVLNGLDSTMREYGPLMQRPDLNSDLWIAHMAILNTAIQQVHVNASNLEPPTGYASTHETLQRASYACAQGVELSHDASATLDQRMLKEAALYIKDCTRLRPEARAQVEGLQR